ncbi:MAG: DUF177 domain-containing protein [Elusimicrobia bacterium]|nr:DUF177 domain-containing protein [Elusimicrobiota bacterium]
MSDELKSLRFEVKRIKEEGGLAGAFELDAAPLVAQEAPGARPAGPVRLEAEFSLGGNRILLQAKLAGAWTLVCSRCLAEHRLGYACAIDETYPLTAEVVDIADDVRQAMLLEIPPRSLCRPDCKGLCPRCGQNLNAAPCGCKAEEPLPPEALKKLTIEKEINHAEP